MLHIWSHSSGDQSCCWLTFYVLHQVHYFLIHTYVFASFWCGWRLWWFWLQISNISKEVFCHEVTFFHPVGWSKFQNAAFLLVDIKIWMKFCLLTRQKKVTSKQIISFVRTLLEKQPCHNIKEKTGSSNSMYIRVANVVVHHDKLLTQWRYM